MSIIFDKMSLIKYNVIMTQEYDIEIYATEEGIEPFNEWLQSFKDKKTKVTILMRIQRLRAGNFGDFKSFDGIYELRINFGPGYRIYCARIGNRLIVLLGGGDKSTQNRDIKKCKTYLEELKRRMV
jgi:putative addiction module killer protein